MMGCRLHGSGREPYPNPAASVKGDLITDARSG
jgi:hypothetical protein